jgi:hypothetical protein
VARTVGPGGDVDRRLTYAPATHLLGSPPRADRADRADATRADALRVDATDHGDVRTMTRVPRRRLRTRRAVPTQLTDPQRDRLRSLLEDPDTWVLGPAWEAYLLRGDEGVLVPTAELTTDQRVAAVAWLRQQRHTLYRALEGGRRAPAGWLEERPLVRRLVADGPAGLHTDP